MFNNPAYDNHEFVAFSEDSITGLKAIIAVHNTALGPALGGCRMYRYQTEEEALEDVLRLSRGMSYKSALAGLPLGGGKAVIIGDPQLDKSDALLTAMGRFINSLSGRYITAEDSGTTVNDMKIIQRETEYVSGIHATSEFGGDPSPHTADGVYCGIEAAVHHRLGVDTVKGIKVAIQGSGAVGFRLAQLLINNGAKVFIADVNAKNSEQARKIGAEVVGVDEIFDLDVDVLSPCALGAVINEKSINRIKATIIAGGANNQLAASSDGEKLREKGILYAPDFVINAGGIIDIHYQRGRYSAKQSRQHIANIGSTLLTIFQRADRDQLSTNEVAERLAEEIFLNPTNKQLAANHGD